MPSCACNTCCRSIRRAARAEPAPGLQHRGQLHHQHQLAELRRRSHDVLFLADGRADHSTTSPPPPSGIAIAAALVRGIARHSATTLGNFWVDLVRTTYYLLLPLCLVFAVFLVSQGMIQNFKPYDTASSSNRCSSKARDRKPSSRARWPRRSRSRCSAPTAAATSTPTPRIRSRTPRRSRTSSRCSRSSPSAAG